MLICPECGTRNAAGTRFCTNCGTYLEWDTAPAPGPVRDVPAPRPAPPPDPRPAPGPGGNDPVPVRRPRPGPSQDGGPQRPRRDRGPGDREDSTDTGRITHSTDKVRRLPQDTLPDRHEGAEQDDRTTVLPRVPGEGPHPQGEHRPGDLPAVPPEESLSRPPRPPDEEPETPPAPGEIVCPRCGAGNSPDRHFCRRCALDLGRALAPPPPPPAVGPRPRRGLSPLVWVLIALVALLALWLLWLLLG